MLLNSGGIKKIHRKSIREGAYGTGRIATHGRRFHVYIVLFRERHKACFDFVDELKTEYSQLPDPRFPALSTEGKKKTFFFSPG